MKRILKYPAVNAVCISLFTLFYAIVFFSSLERIDFVNGLNYGDDSSLWPAWHGLLAAGQQIYIACPLIAVTIFIVALLISRRRPYDEYHTSKLTHCLVIAMVLTLVAIAIFYVMILSDPSGIVEKFTLFIVIHWTTVVFANLVYVLLCRWR